MNFLDWQFSQFTSPAADLHHIIFPCTDKAFRDKEYCNLLEHYHHTLMSTVEKLGSSTDDLFTIDDLHEHMRKYGHFAIFISVLMIPIILADAEDVPDLDDLGERLGNDDGNVSFVNKYSDAKQLIYVRRIRDVIKDLYDLKFHVMPNDNAKILTRNRFKLFIRKLTNKRAF